MARQLSARHEAEIDRFLASGQYADADEVIEQALQLLAEQAEAGQLDHLRALLAVGEEDERLGKTVELTDKQFEAIKQRGRENSRHDR